MKKILSIALFILFAFVPWLFSQEGLVNRKLYKDAIVTSTTGSIVKADITVIDDSIRLFFKNAKSEITESLQTIQRIDIQARPDHYGRKIWVSFCIGLGVGASGVLITSLVSDRPLTGVKLLIFNIPPLVGLLNGISKKELKTAYSKDAVSSNGIDYNFFFNPQGNGIGIGFCYRF